MALAKFPEAILSTNAMALRGKIAETVLASPIRRLRLCIDTVNPEAYPKLRTGGDSDRVAANVRGFLEAARGQPIRIEIQKMVSRVTQGETRRDFARFFDLGHHENVRVIQKTCEPLDTTDATPLHGR